MSVLFGSYNVETGEFQKGYIENGEMKYKREPWYKRIFRRKPAPKVEFVAIRDLVSNGKPIQVAVCKKCEPFSGEILELYAHWNGWYISFSIPAFKATGELILEKWQ